MRLGGEVDDSVAASYQILDQVGELVRESVDAVAVSTAHGHTSGVGEVVRMVRQAFPSLTLIAGNVLLTWPITNSSGFFLEGTASLQPAQWAALNVSPQSDGQNYWVTLAPSGSAIYFRLRKP